MHCRLQIKLNIVYKLFIILGTQLELFGNRGGTSSKYNELNNRHKHIACKVSLYLEDFFMLFETIANIIVERTGRDIAEVKPESTFTELGIDSLDTVELLMSLEDQVGVEIELDQKVETVADLVKFVEGKIQG